jgi:catechol 2,3-dioxygenase-like lactoylglutathione lyase family enzyme
VIHLGFTAQAIAGAVTLAWLGGSEKGRLSAMEPLGVHHVSVNVPDVNEALPFYTDVLGLTRRSDRPNFGFGGAWLDAGDQQQVHLIEAKPPPDFGQHLALAVGDLGATVAELRGSGVVVTDPVEVGPGYQAFLHDPAGNMIELYQRGGAL